MTIIARTLLAASLFVFAGAQAQASDTGRLSVAGLGAHADATMQDGMMRRERMMKHRHMKHRHMKHHRMMKHKRMMKKRRMMRDM